MVVARCFELQHISITNRHAPPYTLNVPKYIPPIPLLRSSTNISGTGLRHGSGCVGPFGVYRDDCVTRVRSKGRNLNGCVITRSQVPDTG